MNAATRNRARRGMIVGLAAGSVLSTGFFAEAATTYTWNSDTTGGIWSAAANWTPNGAPAAGDTANLGDATANRTINYDSASSGSLGTLNFTQTDAFTNLLDVNRSLAITNAVTLGASTGGTSQIFSDPAANTSFTTNFTGGLTINAGGALELESYQTSTGQTSQSTVGGNVDISGGTLLADQSVSNSAGAALAITFNNNLSMSAGTLSIGVNGPAGNAAVAKTAGAVNTTIDRVTVVGNLSLSGGSVVSSTTANNLWVEGSSATIGTLSTALPVQLGLVVNSGSGAVSQTLQSDTAITGGLLIRNIPAGVTSVSDSIGTETAGGTLSFGTGTISFQNANTTNGAIKATLTSNVTVGATPLVVGGTSAAQSVTIDTAGNTLNLGTAAESLSATGTNAVGWSFLSSTGAGTIEASSFDLSGAAGGSTVGANLTLDATGAGGTTNTLSNTHAGTIAPTSTFAYAGSATTSNFAKLASTRTIGNLAVNSGALQLGGPITTDASALTTVAAGATLDLGGATLTTNSVTSNGTLGGSGTLATTAGVTSSGNLSPGEAGAVGSLSLTGGGLTLDSTNDALFDVASDTSFDTVQLNGLAVAYGGTLTVNFTTAPAVGSTYTIFANGVGSSDFSSVVTNLPSSETASFNPGSGVLSINAVPEPSSIVALGLTGAGLLVRRRRR